MRKHISYTEARNELSSVLNNVCLNHEPVVIERRDGGNTVIVSEEDWNSMMETFYLMGSRKDWEAITARVGVDECSDSIKW